MLKTNTDYVQTLYMMDKFWVSYLGFRKEMEVLEKRIDTLVITNRRLGISDTPERKMLRIELLRIGEKARKVKRLLSTFLEEYKEVHLEVNGRLYQCVLDIDAETLSAPFNNQSKRLPISLTTRLQYRGSFLAAKHHSYGNFSDVARFIINFSLPEQHGGVN